MMHMPRIAERWAIYFVKLTSGFSRGGT